MRRSAISIGVVLSFACSLPCCSQQPAAGVASLLVQAQSEESQGDVVDALRDYNAALQLQPDDSKTIFSLGRLNANCGDFRGAESAFRRAIKANPSWAEAHYNLGLTLIAETPGSPDWVNSMPEFTAALKLRPNYPEASNMLGVGLIETGEAANAASVLQSALSLSPQSAELHFNHGRALQALGKREDAGDEYATALKLRSNYPEAEYALGNIILNRGDYPSAAVHFRAALVHNPDMEEAHFGLAKALKAEGQARQAQLELEQVSVLIQRRSDAVMSSNLSNKSLDMAKQGDIPGAMDTAQKALALDRTNMIAHYNLGLLLADSGDLHGGILELRKAISWMPMRISAYIDMSRMQKKLGDNADALASADKAVHLDASDQTVQNWLKTLRKEESRPSDAASQHQEADLSFPYGATTNSVAGHIAFANELSKEGDYTGAIGELQKALLIQSGDVEMRYNLALAYSRSGDSKNAQLEFRKMLYASPDSVEAHLGLATLLFEGKNIADAVSELKEVLAVQPDNREAVQLLAKAQGASTLQ